MTSSRVGREPHRTAFPREAAHPESKGESASFISAHRPPCARRGTSIPRPVHNRRRSL